MFVNHTAQVMNEQGKIAGHVMITILNGQHEMRAKAIVEVKLANASQRRMKVPVPIHKVRIGGLHGVGATLPDRCHRYDFLVRLIGMDLYFLNFFISLFSLGIDHDPHVLYVHMTYV